MSTEVETTSIGTRRLRLGMIGGGQGAYIGGIHRFAARLDGHYDLVAGTFDVDATPSRPKTISRLDEPTTTIEP